MFNLFADTAIDYFIANTEVFTSFKMKLHFLRYALFYMVF